MRSGASARAIAQRRAQHLEQVDRGRVGDHHLAAARRRPAARSCRRCAAAGRSSRRVFQLRIRSRPHSSRTTCCTRAGVGLRQRAERIAVEVDHAVGQLELRRAAARAGRRASSARQSCRVVMVVASEFAQHRAHRRGVGRRPASAAARSARSRLRARRRAPGSRARAGRARAGAGGSASVLLSAGSTDWLSMPTSRTPQAGEPVDRLGRERRELGRPGGRRAARRCARARAAAGRSAACARCSRLHQRAAVDRMDHAAAAEVGREVDLADRRARRRP